MPNGEINNGQVPVTPINETIPNITVDDNPELTNFIDMMEILRDRREVIWNMPLQSSEIFGFGSVGGEEDVGLGAGIRQVTNTIDETTGSETINTNNFTFSDELTTVGRRSRIRFSEPRIPTQVNSIPNNLSVLRDRDRIIERISRDTNEPENSEYSTMYELYENSNESTRMFLENEYAKSKYSYLDNDLQKVNRKVSLFENYKETIMSDDGIYISGLGWFKKDDKRLCKDYLNDSAYIIPVKEYHSSFTKIFTDIDKEGNLICNNTLTASKNYQTKIIYNPEVSLKSESGICYFDIKLLNNETFKNNFVESISKGVFYSIKEVKNHDALKKIPKTMYRKYKSETGLFLESIKNKPNTFINTLGMKYQFGLELETISGYLPIYLDKDLYYSAVHDGSLRDEEGIVYGGEYVSDILQGDLGLQQTKKLCFELSKRCLVDKKCSLHIHLSGVTFSKENIILMYHLYYNLQEEIYSMMPKSRRKNEYCRKLDNLNIDISRINPDKINRSFYIDKYYSDIIMFLSKKDYSSKSINKKKDHPKGFKCNYDHSASRYCWVNFVPAVFDTRGNGIYTIEFRSHSGTTSYMKVKNWLLICYALIDVVENHKRDIYDNPNINLSNIISVCYPKNDQLLISYIEDRKKKFADKDRDSHMLAIENHDYLDNELDNDFKLKNL